MSSGSYRIGCKKPYTKEYKMKNININDILSADRISDLDSRIQKRINNRFPHSLVEDCRIVGYIPNDDRDFRIDLYFKNDQGTEMFLDHLDYYEV